MTVYKTSEPDNLARKIFRMLPIPVRVKNDIKKIHRYFKGCDKSGFSEPGTINNQEAREQTIKLILNELKPQAIVETGSYLGAGTKFFLSNTENCRIYSCEIHPEYFAYCTERFAGEARISLSHGNSVTFLKTCDLGESGSDAELLFYLDAHWEKYLPLADEIDTIFARWPQALIIVDDFAVPGDKGYGYDDYGHGQALNEAYIRQIPLLLSIFYPKIHSSKETGGKRGCCFLCLPGTKAHALLLRHPDIFLAV